MRRSLVTLDRRIPSNLLQAPTSTNPRLALAPFHHSKTPSLHPRTMWNMLGYETIPDEIKNKSFYDLKAELPGAGKELKMVRCALGGVMRADSRTDCRRTTRARWC